ncbi:MAG TPA: MFS transporter, partial [Candidatus Angelobacter sp.]|nr:MFS transporter [Candidatus Angelobacter sp.]
MSAHRLVITSARAKPVAALTFDAHPSKLLRCAIEDDPLMENASVAPAPPKPSLTSNQKRGFLAAWGGWALDGMDSFIYALVLVPALRDVLPKSGIQATNANIGYYGSLLFALFLIGWGLALVWGPIADRFGRARTLMLTILWFSLFTFLSALATNVWSLAIFRLLAGLGIGGEWSVGATFISEEWPEERRKVGAGLMHTGYYFGFFLAAIANFLVGAHYGWRWMFVVGGTPALLVAFFYNRVHEPARWHQKRQEHGHTWTALAAFRTPFSPRYRRRTILNSLYLTASIVGLWAGSVYVPTAITQLAAKAGRTAVEAAKLSSYGTALLAIGTILGALMTPWLCERFGRKSALGFFFSMMFVFIALAFGFVFYLQTGALAWFMACLFFLGIGGANFAVYSLWIPEQYGTECRVSAFAFTTNIGRFAGAGFTFLVGAGIR